MKNDKKAHPVDELCFNFGQRVRQILSVDEKRKAEQQREQQRQALKVIEHGRNR